MKTIITIILIAIYSLQLQAQIQQELPEYQVTENRIQTATAGSNRNVQIISSEQIRSMPAQSVTDVLNNIIGLDVRSRGAFNTQADFNIQAGTFEQTLILIDGVKVSDPQTGHHLLNVPLSTLDIDHIEILKGSAARVYGQNAYAGVIHIITRKPTQTQVRVHATYGENKYMQTGAYVSFGLKKIKQSISINQQQSDGYKLNSDFRILNGYYQANWQKNQHSISVNGGFIDKKMGENGFYTTSFPYQYEEIQSQLAGIQYENASWHHLKTFINYRGLFDRFELKRDTPSFSENRNQTYVYQSGIQLSDRNRYGIWNLGADLRNEYLQGNNMGNHQRTIAGMYIGQTMYWGKHIQVIPGLGYNYYSAFGQALYPGMDIGYQWGKVRFGASVNRTFRVPTFTDMYYTDAWATSLGNAQLRPETATNHELNMRFQQPGIELFGSVFYRDGIHQIDWIKTDSMPKTWQSVNLGSTTVIGQEIRVRIQPARLHKTFKNISDLQFGWQHNALQYSVENGTLSRYVSDFLQQQITSSITFQWKALRCMIRERYQDRVGYTNYHIEDIRCMYLIKKWDFYVEASNVGNVLYYDYISNRMPGRWIRGGFTFSLTK